MAEVERLSPDGHNPSGSHYWSTRANRFARRMPLEAAAGDPFLSRIRRSAGRRSTVIDVGSGPGRFALSLAPRVAEVVAVDPAPSMLTILRRQARRLGIDNVRCVMGRWPDVEVPQADVAFSSFVLALVPDAPPFLRKLDAIARRRVLLYLSAFANDALLDPFWRHFHDKPRLPAPTYLDALAVLRELGIPAEVEVVQLRSPRFATMAEAVADYRNYLALPATREVSAELKRLLAAWLVRTGDGLSPPLVSTPAAIITWTPRG